MKRLYWLVPILAFVPQLMMTLNSFNQMRFEEFFEAVQAPFWFANGQIINGLHVNVGWYAFLVAVYNIFGFSLHTGKIIYLVMAFFSNFALFYLLRRFFKGWWIASIILLTITLSPTYLYMNAVNLHWGLTFHILIVILVLLYHLDFKKRRLSLVISGAVFFLAMWGWLSYQAFVFYLPSLVIFYLWKLRKFSWQYLTVSAIAFLLPLLLLFVYVDNRHILIADSEVGGGLFRGGGKFNISEEVFVQGWVDFLSDFFIRGVSHHYEVASSEFSYVFPIITLIFMIYTLIKMWTIVGKMKQLVLLVLLVIVFDLVVFSTTSDLGLPGMKRLTPMLVSIYFLWVLVWFHLEGVKAHLRGVPKVWGMRIILSLFLLHHLIVYPVNLAAIKEPSPFKVADWFEGENPQTALDQYVVVAQKEDLILDCRPIIEKFGACNYDFIYSAVALSCKFNHLNCYQLKAWSPVDNKFIDLSIDSLKLINQ